MHPKEQLAGNVDAIVTGKAPHPLYDPAAWPKLLADGRASFEARVRAERERARSGAVPTR
jgi:hypothetical protein